MIYFKKLKVVALCAGLLYGATALAELALSEGQLDFALYDLDDDSVDDLDIDVLPPLWEAGDEDGEEPGDEW